MIVSICNFFNGIKHNNNSNNNKRYYYLDEQRYYYLDYHCNDNDMYYLLIKKKKNELCFIITNFTKDSIEESSLNNYNNNGLYLHALFKLFDNVITTHIRTHIRKIVLFYRSKN